MVEYDLNRPWLTLDDWQKKYIKTPANEDCFILSGRQCGKTTAMSIKAVELCVKHFSEGEIVLISSLTERQAQFMLKKAQVYAEAKYSKKIDKSRENKPTMHRIFFKNGTGILCYAAGEEGDSTRGFTLKKLMIDEGSRMAELYFVSATPTLSVSGGSMDIGSTPAGKKDKEGNEKFFYKCSKDEHYKKFYITAEDCPRHSKEFLAREKERMSKLQYAQEYLAQFLDELKRVFDEELIKKICILKRRNEVLRGRDYYIGVDVAGFGEDACTYEVFHKLEHLGALHQVENIIEKRNFTTDTSKKVIKLNEAYNFKKIGVDDGGVGFGVFSELMNENKTKRKTFALNNASRPIDKDGEKSKKLLKEEMYLNLLSLMENNKVFLLDDDEVEDSLRSIQHEDEKIFGSNSHVVEGIIRACWLASEDKSLNIFVRTF